MLWCCVFRFESLCPVLLTGPLPAAGYCSLSELFVRKLYRWTRPCFSGPKIDACTLDASTGLAAACPDGTPPFRSSGHALNAPQLNKPEPFWLVLSAPKPPEIPRGISGNSGRKMPSPAASTGGQRGQSGTLLEATGGTQTHSRRTG